MHCISVVRSTIVAVLTISMSWAAPVSLRGLSQLEQNLASSLHFLDSFIALSQGGVFQINHGNRDTAQFSLTCDLLAQFQWMKNVPGRYGNFKLVIATTLQDSCFQLREKYGPLPTESSVSSNSTSSNCTSSTNSSCSGTSKSCSNVGSSPDQGCCDLSYLQTHCASHLLESIKDTSNKLFADYRHLTGYYWCDWIDRNRASLTASLLQLFSWC